MDTKLHRYLRCAYVDLFGENDEKNDHCAVFVESRRAWSLYSVIKHTMWVLGEGWNLRIFASRNNYMELKTMFPQACITVVQCSSKEDLNKLFTFEKFWRSIPEEHILVFQLDSILLHPLPKHVWNYDMVGAPCGDLLEFTMNGGLSTRKRSAMIRVLRRHLRPDGEPEDVFFTRHLRSERKCPSFEVCVSTFVESIYHEDACGWHGTDKSYLPIEYVDDMVQRLEDNYAAYTEKKKQNVKK